MNKDATGRIRITSIPEGEAPDWVRRQWIGLELPCFPIEGLPCIPSIGTVSKTSQPKKVGVCVPQDDALELLGSKSERALEWWRNRGYPLTGQYFSFNAGEYEIVSGVTLQKVTEVPHEAMGDSNR